MAEPGIPMTPSEITSEWITRALASRFPGVECTDLDIVGHHAGTTGRARLRAAYARDVGAPASIFAKLPPPDPTQRAIVQATGMGWKEARFYAEVADQVPVRVPGPLHGAWSDDGASYIVLMEDLEPGGCTFPDGIAGADADFAGRVVTSLARLHAHYWNSARFGADLAWIGPPARHEVGPTLVAAAVEAHGRTRPPVFAELGSLYVDHHEAIHDLWEQGEQTLAHGDAHVGNLFADGDSAGFLDWGIVSCQPGMRDFAEFLSTSVATELRRAGEGEWMSAYLTTLASCGADAPDPDVAWRRYAIHASYAFVAAATTLAMGDRWQPLAFTEQAMSRALAAVEDLGSAEILRDELGV